MNVLKRGVIGGVILICSVFLTSISCAEKRPDESNIQMKDTQIKVKCFSIRKLAEGTKSVAAKYQINIGKDAIIDDLLREGIVQEILLTGASVRLENAVLRRGGDPLTPSVWVEKELFDASETIILYVYTPGLGN